MEEQGNPTQGYGFTGCCSGCLLGGFGVPIALLLLLAVGSDDAGGPLWWIFFALFCGFAGAVIGWLVARIVARIKN